MTFYVTKQVGLGLMLQKVLCLNVSMDARCPDMFHGFPQYLQENAWIVPHLGHDQFLPNHLPSIYSVLCSLAMESIIK
jgi:hypothetical protein